MENRVGIRKMTLTTRNDYLWDLKITLRLLHKANPSVKTIDDFFGLLLECWCRETAYPSAQVGYVYESDPTYGQCAITATLVCDVFGGTIHKIKVEGGGTHYFNRIKG